MTETLDQFSFIPEIPRRTVLSKQQVKELYADGFHSPTAYDPAKHYFDPSTVDVDVDSLFREAATIYQRCRMAAAVATNRSIVETYYPAYPVLLPSKPMVAYGMKVDSMAAANFVRDDDPAEHLVMARRYASKVPPRRGLFSEYGSDFVNGPPAIAAVMDMQPGMVSPTIFAFKWFHMLLRPQQLWERVLSGQIAAPPWFEKLVTEWHLTHSPEEMPFHGMYPRHPSRVAMHSAVARSAMILFVLLDMGLTDVDMMVDLIEHDRVMAHARDSLGVHYWEDSDLGLALAPLILRETIPQAVEFMGGDPEMARSLCDQFIAEYSPQSLKLLLPGKE